jgi:predicted house-cleaning noncanonical NTP pyrophosphatase (MazG superfamily)
MSDKNDIKEVLLKNVKEFINGCANCNMPLDESRKALLRTFVNAKHDHIAEDLELYENLQKRLSEELNNSKEVEEIEKKLSDACFEIMKNVSEAKENTILIKKSLVEDLLKHE